MTRLTAVIALLISFSNSFCQWTRVQQLPATDISTIYHKNGILYAGGKNIIYISRDNGQTWDSTGIIQPRFLVTSIIIYKNELYAAAPRKGVFKSQDDGASWQNISAGIYPDVSDFCEFRGDLYAATLGNSVYKLEPASRNRWLSFSNGLSSISWVSTAIIGTGTTLIAGTNDNGLYDYLPANSTTWEERFLLPRVSVSEGAYDIITAHDTLFWPGKTGKFYVSTNNGLTWNLFGNRLISAASTLVNARQALVSSIHFFNANSFQTAFFYIKKDSLQRPFVNFSVVRDHFTYKTDILGDKLWDASDKGLFFMPLTNLPGITAADDSVPVVLPVRFISFTANCQSNKVVLKWTAVQDQNDHYNIEKSIDGIQWTVIGKLPVEVNSAREINYSFTDNNTFANNYYRIASHNRDGRVQYTSILRTLCNTSDVFSIWPNPTSDIAFIKIVTADESEGIIKVFDHKGALVNVKQVHLLKGSNQLSINMNSLAKGLYSFSISWNNDQINKVTEVLKR